MKKLNEKERKRIEKNLLRIHKLLKRTYKVVCPFVNEDKFLALHNEVLEKLIELKEKEEE